MSYCYLVDKDFGLLCMVDNDLYMVENVYGLHLWKLKILIYIIQKKLGSWELRHRYPLQIRPRLVIGWTPSISETPNSHRPQHIPRVMHRNLRMTSLVTAILRREDRDSISALLPALPCPHLKREGSVFHGLKRLTVQGPFSLHFSGVKMYHAPCRSVCTRREEPLCILFNPSHLLVYLLVSLEFIISFELII